MWHSLGICINISSFLKCSLVKEVFSLSIASVSKSLFLCNPNTKREQGSHYEAIISRHCACRYYQLPQHDSGLRFSSPCTKRRVEYVGPRGHSLYWVLQLQAFFYLALAIALHPACINFSLLQVAQTRSGSCNSCDPFGEWNISLFGSSSIRQVKQQKKDNHWHRFALRDARLVPDLCLWAGKQPVYLHLTPQRSLLARASSLWLLERKCGYWCVCLHESTPSATSHAVSFSFSIRLMLLSISAKAMYRHWPSSWSS